LKWNVEDYNYVFHKNIFSAKKALKNTLSNAVVPLAGGVPPEIWEFR
jgi:hypothetical protein